MRCQRLIEAATLLILSAWNADAYRNNSHSDLLQSQFRFQDDRSPECPPCFNCMLPAFSCAQYATCNEYNGKCSCPPGFGGEDCSVPVCGALADGNKRLPRKGDHCECEEGWEGINCNVCKTDRACDALMPEGTDGVCFKQSVVVNENYQMCDVTNRKILDQLKEKKPQVTFSCNAKREECNFQCKFGRLRYVEFECKLRSNSLGCRSGIFLLRIRHVLLERQERLRSKHHLLPMRTHQVSVYSRTHALWRRRVDRHWRLFGRGNQRTCFVYISEHRRRQQWRWKQVRGTGHERSD